ncbi:N-acetyltransferase [Vibrio sp. Isolate25]|uniref:GNAT family N-acetyltransferase n=1 Tax=Vibrio TaxID=662 RepID=UPI001EFC377C|nr:MULTISPECIES: N-acetyltransferase [Vibrio]MCG9596493.1 N-acetyltransferase [Vibrio sp. Isolate25]MCG9678163.1 N-acetyltransferase [Vibrio sp. Isolate24]MCG9683723.1 N-acetyltransferase [Vibrio sp. Isolate23]USD32051.1 N-acetyltransferase [Vibrio sp. SCSIO 43186]USD45092.1 N-acetyltransferase [Vibrio sp. SCSIO 43145]
MLIRTEAPADILAVDRLLKSAFETEAEADLVMRLRENGRRTLSLVACNDEGEVVGHVMFSPVTLNHEELSWQGLAPLAIKEGYRRQGLAAELVKEGFESLREFGYPACVVLGEPDYYSRFGFEASENYGFHCQWEVPKGAFQVIELSQGEFLGRSGLIEYSPEFSAF